MNAVQKLQLRLGEMLMSILEAESIIEQQSKEIESLKLELSKDSSKK